MSAWENETKLHLDPKQKLYHDNWKAYAGIKKISSNSQSEPAYMTSQSVTITLSKCLQCLFMSLQWNAKLQNWYRTQAYKARVHNFIYGFIKVTSVLSCVPTCRRLTMMAWGWYDFGWVVASWWLLLLLASPTLETRLGCEGPAVSRDPVVCLSASRLLPPSSADLFAWKMEGSLSALILLASFMSVTEGTENTAFLCCFCSMWMYWAWLVGVTS